MAVWVYCVWWAGTGARQAVWLRSGTPQVLRGGTEQPTCVCWALSIMLQPGSTLACLGFSAASVSLLHDHLRTSPRDPQLLPLYLALPSVLVPSPAVSLRALSWLFSYCDFALSREAGIVFME